MKTLIKQAGVSMIVSLSLSLSAVATHADGGSSSAGASSHGAFATVKPSNVLGYALTKEIARTQLALNVNSNLFLSPASAAMALQMLMNGAGRESTTYSEMSQTLGLEADSLELINGANHTLLGYFLGLGSAPSHPALPGDGAPPTPFTLTLANSVWSNSSSPFRMNAGFIDTLKTQYGALASEADFSKPSGAETLNKWASDETHGKITQVVDARSLAAMNFVLMNATYFKANWQSPFQVARTAAAAFTRGDGSSSQVQMMATRSHGYKEVAGNQVMELPYAGGDASMFVVLPASGRAVGALLEDSSGPLSSDFWTQVAQADNGLADFSMPRFGFSGDFDLEPALEKLGMRTLFTAQADLSAAGSPATFVSSVKQDTYVKVDEQGTEAAAVTTILAGGSAFHPEQVHTMNVNRPFAIAIVERQSGSVLFLGEVSNP